MYILITNDDGIDASGLLALVNAAQRRNHRIVVCAPMSQQSAASQRIHINSPILAEKRNIWDGVESWAIAGTPADCVRLAFELIDVKPDICFSGINNGENAGSAVYYSGTFSAAREAAMHNIPSFSVSIMPGADMTMLDALADLSLDIAEKSRLEAFPRLSVININAPAISPDEWKGLKHATVSQAFYLDRYEHRISPRNQHYFWLANGLPMEPPDKGSDYDLLFQGYVTLSVVGAYSNLNYLSDTFLPSTVFDPEC